MLFYDDFRSYVAAQTRLLDDLEAANIPEVGVIVDVFGPAENQDMAANPGRHSVTQRVPELMVDCAGIDGDRHRGLTRPSTTREGALYRNTAVAIANRRQLFAVSPHECQLLSQKLQVEVTPQLLGANLCIARRDGEEFYLSDIPTNTYRVIGDPDAAEMPRPPVATLIQYLQQKGCSRTGRALATAYDDGDLTERFVDNAEFRRGILCGVEYPADQPTALRAGQLVFFKFPVGACY